MGKIRNNFSSFHDVWLIIEISCFVTVLPLFMRFSSLPTMMRTLTPDCKEGKDNQQRDTTAGKIIKYTEYVLNRNFWIYKRTCLKRSLTLYYFLRRAGINTQIFFGVRFDNNQAQSRVEKEFQAHAWLVLDGKMYLEKHPVLTQFYKKTYCYPEEGQHDFG